MMLRTPPPKRPRDNIPIVESPPTASDRRLVIYEDPSPLAGPDSSHGPSDHMLCTYQCRQMVKADFFDALDNAEKQVREYQSKLEELNENFLKAEAERKKFRDQFLQTEQELAAAKGREEALKEQLLKEVHDSQERLRKQIQTCSELEVKFRNEMNLRLKAESAAISAEEKATLLEGKLSHLSDSIEREKKHFNNELIQLKRESKFSVSRISADLERMECRANNAEKESELLKEQLEDLKKQLNESLHQKGEVEKNLSNFTFQESTSTESTILVKHLQEEIRNYVSWVSDALVQWIMPMSVRYYIVMHVNDLSVKRKMEPKVPTHLQLEVKAFTSCRSSKITPILARTGACDGACDIYEAEVREARKLKSSHENIDLLKEKLLEEKGRKEKAELELSKLQEVQQSMNKLEDELSSWKSLMKDIPGVSCSEDIPVKFAALQKEVIDSMMKLGETNAQLKKMEVALDDAQLGKRNAETEGALAKEKAEVSESEVKRIKLTVIIGLADRVLQLSVVTEERDKLRNVVNEIKKSKNDDGGNETANQTLIQELESSLSKKDCFIAELESNLREQQETNRRQRVEIELLNERLNNEARRIKSLERESDRLRSEISLLEAKKARTYQLLNTIKLGHGDFSSANTKVLRMVNTLAVDNEAKQTIEALQTELQKTKEKLQAVEELKSQSGDSGKLVDSYISGKILQLKEQIATLEKREERYKTVFADRISVFRRACCELFGYKIVMDENQRPNGIPVTRFTLQSIYAQSDDEKLEFEYESGNTNIMANEYTSQREISRQIEIFIRKMNSIPAFTANLTVESFNRRTLS
ncbi:hypothetical protein JRO89_XS02G0279000 [Xanthoceras sorbifolium]|uniref:Mitotic spindle checkpoint protein MAD1 n=1 Tax=Xanthoceras sorbifolium TaxID=99658 RepID=A0ABQ8IHY1_9ROSI|nr:hypothetical protein JRO89_XS02G0279000 [Xanthoceras sorbifolium]